MELVRRLGGSPERHTILKGFFDLRIALRSLGMVAGFQWLDGSFVEDIEMTGERAPRDIDVVTFFHPVPSVPANHPLVPILTDRLESKRRFHVDHILAPLDSRPEDLVDDARYWYGLFSHRRDEVWKGLVQIELNTPADDAQACDELNRAGVT